MVDEQMNDYPPITGKLRELVADVNWHEITDNIGGPWLDSWHRAMRDRCDTIDAIHARLEAAYDRLKAERDSMAAALDAAQGEHAFAPESHYMMLPKDADGVPIHVGDVMEWIDPNGEFSLVCTVEAVSVDCFITWSTESGRFMQKDAKDYRHYHAPTVEDVLREFAEGLGVPVADSYVAAAAAKLALRGDE